MILRLATETARRIRRAATERRGAHGTDRIPEDVLAGCYSADDEDLIRARTLVSRFAEQVEELTADPRDAGRETPSTEDTDRVLRLLAALVGNPQLSRLLHARFPLHTYHHEQVGIQALVGRRIIDKLVLERKLPRAPVEMAKRLYEIAPQHRAGLHMLAELELEAGNLDAAADAMRRSLARNGDCPFAQQLLYLIYRRKQELNPAFAPNDMALQDLSDKFCSKPFDTFVTAEGGDVLTCNCGGWLPFPTGNVYSAANAAEIWDSEAAQEIRRSILDGDFSYCSRMLCPYIVGNTLPKRDEVTDPTMRSVIDNNTVKLGDTGPREGVLSHDASCNLACPSCRTEIIVSKRSEQAAYDRARDDILLPLAEKMDGMLTICGHGDPFGSWHYRSIFDKLDRQTHPGLRLDILTNGQLLSEKEWNKMSNVHGMVDFIRVSIDAAEAETYEDLRRPGKWDRLMTNMAFLGDLRKRGEIKYLQISMVVQAKNYRQMKQFVEMGRAFNADQSMFIRLWNFSGSYQENELVSADVCSALHPEHNRLLEMVSDPIFRDPDVSMFNLSNLLTEAA